MQAGVEVRDIVFIPLHEGVPKVLRFDIVSARSNGHFSLVGMTFKPARLKFDQHDQVIDGVRRRFWLIDQADVPRFAPLLRPDHDYASVRIIQQLTKGNGALEELMRAAVRAATRERAAA